MKKEDKELLLKDLCGRLPYNTMVSMAEGEVDGVKWNEVELTLSLLNQIEEEGSWEFVKPYLRPMSSMTEEEKSEYKNFYPLSPRDLMPPHIALQMFGWLLKNHFDFCDLIPKGLALPAPEGMYNF